jgi:hypothetical protein
MGLLIDECVDEDLRLLFPGHDCQTARFAKLAGLKNGRLLEAAEAAGFDVLITVDQSIPNQQNLAGLNIALLILCGPTNRLRDLELLVPAAVSALHRARRCRENQLGAPAGWLEIKLDGFFDIPPCLFLGVACRRAAWQFGANGPERLCLCVVFEHNAKLHG